MERMESETKTNTKMKNKLAFAWLALFLFTAASPTPAPFDVNTVDFSKISEADMAKTEAHRQELLGSADKKLQQVGEVAADQSNSLADAAKATEEAKAAFAAYKKVTEDQITKGNIAIAQLNGVLVKYHKVKWILSAIWMALVGAIIGFIILKLPLPLKAYSLYIAAAGFLIGAAGTTFIWIRL
jgi:hypothetical protein